MRRGLLLTMLVLVPVHHCLADPSFDCSKAATSIEKTICSDPELSKLDTQLSASYAKFRATLSDDDREALSRWQKKWLKRRDTDCTAPEGRDPSVQEPAYLACVKAYYEARISRIHEIKIPSPYGVLKYHIIDGFSRESIEYIKELFEEAIKRTGVNFRKT